VEGAAVWEKHKDWVGEATDRLLAREMEALKSETRSFLLDKALQKIDNEGLFLIWQVASHISQEPLA